MISKGDQYYFPIKLSRGSVCITPETENIVGVKIKIGSIEKKWYKNVEDLNPPLSCTMQEGYINDLGTQTTSTTYFVSKNYISCNPNTSYNIKSDSVKVASFILCFFDESKKLISKQNVNKNTRFTTPKDCTSFRFLIYSSYGNELEDDDDEVFAPGYVDITLSEVNRSNITITCVESSDDVMYIEDTKSWAFYISQTESLNFPKHVPIQAQIKVGNNIYTTKVILICVADSIIKEVW